MQQEISNIKLNGLTIGFIYWLQEYHDLRGLRDIGILKFPEKLTELHKEYTTKYPEGISNWT